MSTSLRETQRALIASITGQDGGGVYRTLVRRGLAGVIRRLLPRTAAHLGDLWDRDVSAYLSATLPRSHYLRDTPALFVAHMIPIWSADPSVPSHVPDLARFEVCEIQVTQGPDDPAIDPVDLALDRRVRLAASAAILRLDHAVHLLPEDDASPEVPARERTALCVYRDEDLDPRTLALTPSAAHILDRLAAGDTLGQAVSSAAAATGSALDPAFLQGAAALLEDLTRRGVVRGAA